MQGWDFSRHFCWTSVSRLSFDYLASFFVTVISLWVECHSISDMLVFRWCLQLVPKDQNVGDIISAVKYQKVILFKEQSSSHLNGLPHNPGINKRITLTDMSLHTKIIVSNCLIWDFQIYSLCPSRISLYTYHI